LGDRKAIDVFLVLVASPTPIFSGPFRLHRKMLASRKFHRAVSKCPSKISPKMAEENPSELPNYRSTSGARAPRKFKQK
jgi:hypothetical protein